MVNGGDKRFSSKQVIQWSDEAEDTLGKAQRLCTNAQRQLHITHQLLIDKLPNEVEATEFLFASYKKQFEVIERHLEVIRYGLGEIDAKLVDFDKILNPSLNQLDGIISKLKETQVPSFVQIDNDSGNKNLLDFIATESVTLLKSNIEVYKSNCSKIRDFLHKKFHCEMKQEQQSFIKQHSTICKANDFLVPIQLELRITNGKLSESKSSVGVILKENESLENELVSMLEMITNHFDQCQKAVELLKSENSAIRVNLEVLERDSQELADVFKELNTVCNIISTNSIKSEKLYKQHKAYIDASMNGMKMELERFRTFKTSSIPRFLILVKNCKEITNQCSITDTELAERLTPCEIYAETIKQLIFHYSQFLNIYKSKYLTELHHEQFQYPRKFLRRVGEFLNEELYRMQLEELSHRKNWLAKYGDFIPKEFKLPGEQEMPSVVQVNTQGLGHIQNVNGIEEFNQGEEKQLLALIKRLKSSEL
ncbi:ATG17 [Candida oxycetoniae]|uniref:Autophagy-related protein 17 n=1 Tax=Candida oxycetoniae TaxID=497107 RepID=A0AAI9SWB7_9ASCO|nr:ATG17 [Candida oxycetoniae]KAI3403935.2 ATG17 [Candida oxycetoniae]